MAAMPAKPRKIPAALVARYRAGELNSKALAKILHTAPAKVTRELRRRGIDTSMSGRRSLMLARRKGYKSPAALHDMVVGLYAAGHTLRQVARQTGLTPAGARQVLLRQGATLRSRSARGPSEDWLRLADFARRLRLRRAGAGLSQQALAARCGLRQSSISQLELAETRPTWATLDKLARALGCKVEALGLRMKP
jgi:DNA-binding XRE family transcriptional regulator